MQNPTCLNCHTRPARACGRCHTCYQYLHETGHERPARLFDPPKHCSRCDGGPIHAMGRCCACYVYFHETGCERPRWLFDPDYPCKNPACLRPLRCDQHAKFGYCAACYQYRRRNGSNVLTGQTAGAGGRGRSRAGTGSRYGSDRERGPGGCGS